MNQQPASNKLAGTSLTLGILGWVFYLFQWCFDLTIGLLLTAVTGGSSALCSTVLDFLPLILWLAGIFSGHAALGQIKRSSAPGRRRAVWGLVLGYSGLIVMILLTVLIVILIAAGVRAGILGKVFPSFTK